MIGQYRIEQKKKWINKEQRKDRKKTQMNYFVPLKAQQINKKTNEWKEKTLLALKTGHTN